MFLLNICHRVVRFQRKNFQLVTVSYLPSVLPFIMNYLKKAVLSVFFSLQLEIIFITHIRGSFCLNVMFNYRCQFLWSLLFNNKLQKSKTSNWMQWWILFIWPAAFNQGLSPVFLVFFSNWYLRIVLLYSIFSYCHCKLC